MDKKKFIKSYNSIALKFSNSRKNMKWEEIDYFLDKYFHKKLNRKVSILDVGCGSGRLIEHISEKFYSDNFEYLGVDFSSDMISEAKKNYPNKNFQVIDMENLDKLKSKKFDFVFFIASFHHKKFLRERTKVLENLRKLLKENSIIFMTNWALSSELNYEKYKKSEIKFLREDFDKEDDFLEKQKENIFNSKDFSVKFGEFYRYYHDFSLGELNFLFEENNFEIIENRLFDNKKNIISIFKLK